jgi:hypothetical protein
LFIFNEFFKSLWKKAQNFRKDLLQNVSENLKKIKLSSSVQQNTQCGWIFRKQEIKVTSFFENWFWQPDTPTPEKAIFLTFWFCLGTVSTCLCSTGVLELCFLVSGHVIVATCVCSVKCCTTTTSRTFASARSSKSLK